MASTGLMDRNTDTAVNPAPAVDTGATVAAYKDANQGVLDSLVSSALKRGSIDDPKVRSAIVNAGDAYHKGMLNAIQGSNAPVTELPGTSSVVSSSQGTQLMYTKPDVAGVGRAVGKDTFDAQGNPIGSIMPAGYDTGADAANARMASVGTLMNAPQVNGPEQPYMATVEVPASNPVYTHDRRGNITGVAREATPGSTTATTFDGGGGLMGTPSTTINESTMTPDELRNYRTALASTANAEANLEQNRITDAFNKGMLSFHDKELALKRVELGNEMRKWNMQYGAEMGDKHTELQRKAADIALKSSATQDPNTGAIVYDKDAFNSAYDTVLAKLKGEPAPPPTKEQQDKTYFKSVMEAPIGSGTNLMPVSGGKPIDAATAAQFVRQAGGDRNKARQMAKQAGYTF